MWWVAESDGYEEPQHVCSDACTKAVDGSWVCTHTGAVLGPALIAPEEAQTPITPAQRAGTGPKEWNVRMQFRSAAQHVAAKLLAGERRRGVEGARADRARSLGRRAAIRSAQEDVAQGRLPNLGRALCAAWTVYERSTGAVDASVQLDGATEDHIVRACVDFYCVTLQPAAGRHGAETRASHEGLALAILYLMREGIPGLLEKNTFVSANLPDLSRLKSYGYQISKYTQARRLIQDCLEAAAS